MLPKNVCEIRLFTYQASSKSAFNQSLIYNLRGLLGDPRPTKRLVREPQLPARLKTIKKMCVLKTI